MRPIFHQIWVWYAPVGYKYSMHELISDVINYVLELKLQMRSSV